MPIKPFVIRRTGAFVSFTFDDFFESAGSKGAALLEAAGFNCTFYAARGLQGGQLLGAPYYREAQLPRLAAQGHEIGCHSVSQNAFVWRSRQSVNEDWDMNAAYLRDAVGIDELHTFSYPYGYYDLRACIDAATRFAACRGTRPGINRKLLDLAKLRANPIGPEAEALKLALSLVGDVQRDGGWLIFYTHDVSDSPTPYGCTPSALKSVIEAVRRAQISVLTVRNAVGAISAAS